LTPQEELKKLKAELIEESYDGEYVQVIDKNGKPINYKIKYYAEMCIYTEAIRAQADATVNIAIENETDLVQVSTHFTNCDICGPIEGRVFSISGNDPDFAPVDFELPLHPNCKHTLNVVFREILEKYGVEKYQ
jgi:hypothetical protein